MNATFKISITVLSVLWLTTISSGQKKTSTVHPLPDEVVNILKPFCYSCHGPGGGRLPHSRLNFAIWNGYSPGKQVEKAGLICSSIKKGTMPTKQWNQQNTGLKLTSEQIDRVCRWSESVKPVSEKSGRRGTARKQKNESQSTFVK